MEYSIQALSRLSGVTTRALRWYDEIGLLTPSLVAESGYRFYGEKEVDRLQDILYYRSLGVPLAQIRACLDDPAFDRLAALRSHLAALQAEQARLERLIRSVQDTIGAAERKEHMQDEKKFEAFKRELVAEKERMYGAEARQKYTERAVDASNARVMGMTYAQYSAWEALGEEILQKLEQAVTAGEDPNGEAGRELQALHTRWLNAVSDTCDAQRQRGVAELYVLDERFTAYYDRSVTGCARFLRDAIAHWAAPSHCAEDGI